MRVKCKICVFYPGLCKHVLAFVAWTHYKAIQPSVTEVICYWRKSGLSTVDLNTKPIDMTPNDKPACIPRSKYRGGGSFLAKVKSKLEALHVPSMLMGQLSDTTHPLCMHSLSHKFFTSQAPLKDFFNFKVFVADAIRSMCINTMKDTNKETLIQSKSPLWRILRYCRITASILSSAAVTNENRKREAIESLKNKIRGSEKLPASKAMKRGLDIEDDVRRKFSRDKRRKVEPAHFFMTPELPLFGASPDGIGTDFLLEIKSPQRNESISNYVKADGTRTRKVLLQILLQLKLSGKKKCFLLIPDQDFETNEMYRTIEVFLDDAAEELLKNAMDQAELFWEKNIFPHLAKVMRPIMI